MSSTPNTALRLMSPLSELEPFPAEEVLTGSKRARC
jgi:hypothetical protein